MPAVCAAFLGLASLLVLAAQSLLGAAAQRPEHRKTLWTAAAFPYLSFVIALALNLTSAQHPRVYDLWLYAFDETLKLRASFLIGHLIATAPLLQQAARIAYESLPLAICCLVAMERRSPERFSAGLVRLFVTAGLAGVVLYQFLPAAGPAYVFGKQFPESLPALPGIAIQPILLPRVARNAMPSVHFACALLVWWNTGSCGRVWRALAGGFVAHDLSGHHGLRRALPGGPRRGCPVCAGRAGGMPAIGVGINRAQPGLLGKRDPHRRMDRRTPVSISFRTRLRSRGARSRQPSLSRFGGS